VQLRQKFIEDIETYDVELDHQTLNQLDMTVRGIEVKELQPDNQHKEKWPMGVVDNGTDDHTVLNHQPEAAKEKKEEKTLSNKEPIRPAIQGQWPLGQYTDEYDVTHTYG